MRDGGTLYWLLADQIGSTNVSFRDSDGTTATQRYYVWGAIRSTTGTLPTDYAFTGQRLDNSTGLLHYGARWYDPALARFISADSIVPQPGDPQSLSRYSYVLNCPARFTDPSGHMDADFSDGSGRPRYRYQGRKSSGFKMVETTRGYWIDAAHMAGGKEQAKTVWDALDRGSRDQDIRLSITAKLSRTIGPVHIERTYVKEYWVAAGIDSEQWPNLIVALVQDFNSAFEDWQSTTYSGLMSQSSWNAIDLLSDSAGIYAFLSDMDEAQMVNLIFGGGEPRAKEPSNVPKSHDWTSKVDPFVKTTNRPE